MDVQRSQRDSDAIAHMMRNFEALNVKETLARFDVRLNAVERESRRQNVLHDGYHHNFEMRRRQETKNETRLSETEARVDTDHAFLDKVATELCRTTNDVKGLNVRQTRLEEELLRMKNRSREDRQARQNQEAAQEVAGLIGFVLAIALFVWISWTIYRSS